MGDYTIFDTECGRKIIIARHDGIDSKYFIRLSIEGPPTTRRDLGSRPFDAQLTRDEANRIIAALAPAPWEAE